MLICVLQLCLVSTNPRKKLKYVMGVILMENIPIVRDVGRSSDPILRLFNDDYNKFYYMSTEVHFFLFRTHTASFEALKHGIVR